MADSTGLGCHNILTYLLTRPQAHSHSLTHRLTQAFIYQSCMNLQVVNHPPRCSVTHSLTLSPRALFIIDAFISRCIDTGICALYSACSMHYVSCMQASDLSWLLLAASWASTSARAASAWCRAWRLGSTTLTMRPYTSSARTHKHMLRAALLCFATCTPAAASAAAAYWCVCPLASMLSPQPSFNKVGQQHSKETCDSLCQHTFELVVGTASSVYQAAHSTALW